MPGYFNEDNYETQTNGKINNGGINLADLFKRADVQEDFKKAKERLGMDDIIDRMIHITDFSVYKDKNVRGEEGDFTRINYYFLDDPEKIMHFTATQSMSIRQVLVAIGNDRIKEAGGVNTMVQSVKASGGMGKRYEFAGL